MSKNTPYKVSVLSSQAIGYRSGKSLEDIFVFLFAFNLFLRNKIPKMSAKNITRVTDMRTKSSGRDDLLPFCNLSKMLLSVAGVTYDLKLKIVFIILPYACFK